MLAMHNDRGTGDPLNVFPTCATESVRGPDTIYVPVPEW